MQNTKRSLTGTVEEEFGPVVLFRVKGKEIQENLLPAEFKDSGTQIGKQGESSGLVLTESIH